MFRNITSVEKNRIDSVLREICGKDSDALWPDTTMIVIRRKQNHAHTANQQTLKVLKTIAEKKREIKALTLEYAGREIGVLTRNLFRVGLEIIQELAPYVTDRFIVNQAGETAFLFGKDLSKKHSLTYPKTLTEGKRFIVFSNQGYPLGLAQLESSSNKIGATEPFTKNLVDFGYYLRSGG
ncbi:MAG: hypothetical protein ACE5OZ_16280 [Candidatus Heimdallarchaeota archaeon]